MYHHVSHLFVFCLETALPTHHISYFTIEIIQQQGKKVCKTTAVQSSNALACVYCYLELNGDQKRRS